MINDASGLITEIFGEREPHARNALSAIVHLFCIVVEVAMVVDVASQAS